MAFFKDSHDPLLTSIIIIEIESESCNLYQDGADDNDVLILD